VTDPKSVIDMERSNFDSIIGEEMERIAPDGDAQDNPVQDSTEYQYRFRPLYYSFGYTRPADFLEQQVKYSLLGKPSLTTWIHQDLADRLDGLPGVLTGWDASLVQKTVQQVNTANGLQIRTVKGKDVLSNHAFGLAVDVNALSNPHVVGAAVVAVFNWVALQSGCHFDFGGPVLSRAERGHANYTMDDIMEVHNRAKPASDAVKTWLQENLPRYKKLMEQVKAGEKELGINASPGTKLEDRLHNAEVAQNRLQRQRELKDPNKVCTTPAQDTPEMISFKKVDAALGQISVDPDLQRIQVLYENFDTSYIETWVKQGVMTMPLYLAVALVGELGLQWGEQYEGSKDAMHFELVKEKNTPYIAPDAPLAHGEKPRTLQRLMESSVFKPGPIRLSF